MKKIYLFLSGVLLLAACATENRNQFTGIDYSAYERPDLRAGDDFTARVPVPSILNEAPLPRVEKAQEEEETLSEDEDFTSEEIASSYGRYTDVTVIAAAKRVKLGSAATAKHMALFQKALDTGYKKDLRTYRPSGFTYSISSVGAVNPLSDIEISCILGERAANAVGQQTCNLFFNTVVQEYNRLFQEAKAHATL